MDAIGLIGGMPDGGAAYKFMKVLVGSHSANKSSTGSASYSGFGTETKSSTSSSLRVYLPTGWKLAVVQCRSYMHCFLSGHHELEYSEVSGLMYIHNLNTDISDFDSNFWSWEPQWLGNKEIREKYFTSAILFLPGISLYRNSFFDVSSTAPDVSTAAATWVNVSIVAFIYDYA